MTVSAPALHVETRGAARGRATLLLHGGGVGGWMWRPLTEQLPLDRQLVIPDLPGHDRSGATPYRSHAQTLDALVSVVEAHADEPVSVVGFSLGGQLAVLLAARHPGLVLPYPLAWEFHLPTSPPAPSAPASAPNPKPGDVCPSSRIGELSPNALRCTFMGTPNPARWVEVSPGALNPDGTLKPGAGG